jgi:signal peptidase I
LGRELAADLADSVALFHGAMERGRLGRSHKALEALDKQITEHLGFARKSTVREYAESIGIAVFIALLLRAFVVEAFKIPSGSMIPTLEVGDHIFINKFSYGLRIPFTKNPPRRFVTWSKPARGDVVVFINRKNVDHDFIKRVVAVSGDEVKVMGGTVYLRRGAKGPWKAVKRKRLNRPCRYQDLEKGLWTRRSECEFWSEELDGVKYLTVVDKERPNMDFPPLEMYRQAPLPLGSVRVEALQLFNPYRVPEGKVFVMGDNRTNSQDSRYPKELGFVEHKYIKGKALVVWSSWGPSSSWWGLRWGRIGHVIH